MKRESGEYVAIIKARKEKCRARFDAISALDETRFCARTGQSMNDAFSIHNSRDYN